MSEKTAIKQMGELYLKIQWILRDITVLQSSMQNK